MGVTKNFELLVLKNVLEKQNSLLLRRILGDEKAFRIRSYRVIDRSMAGGQRRWQQCVCPPRSNQFANLEAVGEEEHGCSSRENTLSPTWCGERLCAQFCTYF